MLLGMVIGGVVAVYLLSLLLEWAIFKRVTDNAGIGIPASVAAASILGIIIYGFGSADGGPWNPWPGGVAYIVAGFIVAPLRIRSYHKKRDSFDPNEGLRDTFE